MLDRSRCHRIRLVVESLLRTSLRRIEILHEVISSKLNDAQLPELTSFHAAYWRYDKIVRTLDEYFAPTSPLIDRDARVDIRGPVHEMISTLIRVEILAG